MTTDEMLDRVAIGDLISRYAAAVDAQRLREERDLYVDGFLLEFPAVSFAIAQGRRVPAPGDEANGPVQIKGNSGFERTQHLTTNVLVDVDGDRAAARADLFAVHVHDAQRPESHFDLGGVYEFEAVRTADGWRLSRLRLTPVWTAGDGPGPDTL